MQLPALVILVPFFSALLAGLLGIITPGLLIPTVIAAAALQLFVSVLTLNLVLGTGTWQYVLGGWTAPYGIEFVVDSYTAAMLVVISFVSLLVVVHSRSKVVNTFESRTSSFYALFFLAVTGLCGLVITGDAFNLYVFLEISSLTSYALIARGNRKSILASFQYLMLGSVGACFYLLGVGYLYLKTGTLNMADMSIRIKPLLGTPTVTIGLLMIILGMAMKMALFPLHAWLPNAYTHAPFATRALLAPLATKVSVFVLIRLFVSVFGLTYIWSLPWGSFFVLMSCVAIIAGSLYALAQKSFGRMLTYLIVAEVGYMMGGIWLGNYSGLHGAAYHVLADALMTVCLFLAAGNFAQAGGIKTIDDFKGAFQRMPFTMAAFVIVAMSMIGVPPTCGFISKWYLILGALESGKWWFMVSLLFSSLVNVVLFFRIFEKAFFSEADTDHGHHNSEQEIQEASLPMVGALTAAALSVVLLGWYSGFVISDVIKVGLGG